MAKAGKTSSIKYADKSAGQPELVKVFSDLKKLLSQYAKGNYSIKDDAPGSYSVYYNLPVDVAGRRYPELPFAALLVQKGYVGFYFFPVYTDPSLKTEIPPALLKMLKGKSCFHFKQLDAELQKQLKAALDAGYRLYARKGWK